MVELLATIVEKQLNASNEVIATLPEEWLSTDVYRSMEPTFAQNLIYFAKLLKPGAYLSKLQNVLESAATSLCPDPGTHPKMPA